MADPLTLALHIDHFMRRLHAEMHPRALAVDAQRIGPLGGMILMTIEEHEPVPAQRVATLLARDKGQMARTLQMLERKGFVTRQPSAEDGRVSLVSLTETGRDQVKSFQNALAETVEGLTVMLSKAEKTALLETLQKIRSAADPAE